MTHFMKRAAAAAVLIAALPFSAEAFPIATAPAAQADAGLTLVAGGCGPGFHRGPLLGCRPNRMVVVARSSVGRSAGRSCCPCRIASAADRFVASCPVGPCPPDIG